VSFENFEAFLAMGGHGLYVWVSYGMALLVILFNFLWPLHLNKGKARARISLLRRESLLDASNETGRDGS